MDVSIVICTRNRASTLGGTLRSLARCRTSLDWEALIVDNASTDDTESVVRHADNLGGRLRYLRAERIGLGAARDFGWRHAKGRIISFTDDDCYVAPDFVDAVASAFARRPEGCLGGRILLYDKDDYPVTIDERTIPSTIPPHSFVAAGELQGANLSFRREVLEAIGGFDPALGAGTPFPCEDADVVAAAVWAGYSAGFDPEPVVFHHHRRRAADVPRLWTAYERGRGAYFAKYILRPDTRKAFLLAWIKSVLRSPKRKRVYQELAGALTYLKIRRES